MVYDHAVRRDLQVGRVLLVALPVVKQNLAPLMDHVLKMLAGRVEKNDIGVAAAARLVNENLIVDRFKMDVV